MKPFSLLLLLLTASCSSIEFRPEVAAIASAADLGRLGTHLEGLEHIGPRPASAELSSALTLRYLHQRLAEAGLETVQETFALTPSSRLEMTFEDGQTIVLPDTYFSANISQARVVHGFADATGIEAPLASYSLLPIDSEPYPIDQVNLYATIPGAVRPERILEISAHYDTVPNTVGADDNGSGVAALLEVARLLAADPPDCTVRLCFFAAEEIGLKGSREHVRRIQESGEISQVFGLINLDAVGLYRDEPDSQQSPARIPFVVWPPTTGNFLTIIGANGSASLAGLVEDSGKLYAPELPLYVLGRLGGFLPDARRSDHAPYWDADIPAVFLTDTGEFRSDNYHRPADALDTVDLPRLRQVAVLVTAAALEACTQEAGI